MLKLLVGTALLLLGLLHSTAILLPAAPVVIYSNLGPGDSFVNSGYGIGGAGDQDLAAPFTPAAATTLDSFQVVVWDGYIPTAPGFFIYLAAGPAIPGPPIEVFSYPPFPAYPTPGLVTINSVLHPALSAGVQYWIVMGSADPAGVQNAAGSWYINDQGVTGVAHRDPFLPNYPDWTIGLTGTPTLRVYGEDSPGSAIPEPGALWLAVTGFAALCLAGRRRRRVHPNGLPNDHDQ